MISQQTHQSISSRYIKSGFKCTVPKTLSPSLSPYQSLPPAFFYLLSFNSMLTPLAFVSSLLPISTLTASLWFKLSDLSVFNQAITITPIIAQGISTTSQDHPKLVTLINHLRPSRRRRPKPLTKSEPLLRSPSPQTSTTVAPQLHTTQSIKLLQRPTVIQFNSSLCSVLTYVVHHLRAQLSSHHNLLSTPKLSEL